MAREVLPQDQAQASQAEGIEAQRQYEKDLAQYEKELEEYEKNKAAIEEANRKEKEALEKVKQKEIARLEAERKARAAEEKRINDAINAYREQYWRRYPGSKGSSANVAINKYAFKLRGGSEAQWNALRREEERNRKISQRQSAGLRASGNAQIKAAEQAELARLGGSSTSGPTKVSSTLGSSGKIADLSAPGVAAKAQDFGKGFTYETRFYGYSTTGQAEIERIQKVAEYERQQANQATINRLGLSHDVEQLNKQDVSSIYNTGVLQVPEPPKQVNMKPLANKPEENVSVKNKVAPYLIPLAERSKIGYAPDGKPYVGPTQPQGKWAVETKDGKVRVFKDWDTAQKFSQRMESPRYQVTTLQWKEHPIGVIPQQKVRTFKDLETAEKFGLRTSKGKTASGESIESYWTVQTKEGEKQFATKEEADKFIQAEQDKLPYTDAKILPLESLYKSFDKSAKQNKKNAEERPHDIPRQFMATSSSVGAGILNTITFAGDLIDKHILKQPVKEKKPVTIATKTFYDEGLYGALEGMSISAEAPFIKIKENPIQKGLDKAQEQWAKQTPAQNIAQSTVAAGIVAFDIATLGRGGMAALSPLKYTAKKTTKVANKITGKVEEVTEGAKIRLQIPPITYSIAKVQPIRRVQPKILTAAGDIKPVVSHYQFGYGKARIDLGGKYGETGKFYKGKPLDYEQTGLRGQSGAPYQSSFDTHQVSHYTDPEVKVLTPLVKAGEEKGVTELGRWDLLLKERATALEAARKSKYIRYKNKVNKGFLTDIHEAIVEPSAWKNYAKIQKEKLVTKIKGSGVFNIIEEGVPVKIKDVDSSAVTDAKGMKAADILISSETKPGFVYGREAGKTNVFIGEVDETKPIWNLFEFAEEKKGVFIRGTNLKRAKQLEKDPTSFTSSPREVLWTTDSPKIAKTFGKKAVQTEGGKEARVGIKLDMSKIKRFEDLTKEQKETYRGFFKGQDDWKGSQDYLEKIAREEGKLGYTKPYKSLSEKARKETVVYDPAAIKDIKNLKPTGYGMKEGTKTEVFNIVSSEEELSSVIGADTNKFYGRNVKTGSVKVKTGGPKKEVVEFQDLIQQNIDLKGSISGISDKETLRGFKDWTPELEKKVFPPGIETKYAVPLPHRTKDIVRSYFWADRNIAKAAWKAGDKKFAKKIGQAMKERYEADKGWIDWRKEIQAQRREGNIEINFKDPKPTSDNVLTKTSPRVAIAIEHGGRTSREIVHGDALKPDEARTQPESLTARKGTMIEVPKKTIQPVSKSTKIKGITKTSPKTKSRVTSGKSKSFATYSSITSSRISSRLSKRTSPKLSVSSAKSSKSPKSPKSSKSVQSPISPSPKPSPKSPSPKPSLKSPSPKPSPRSRLSASALAKPTVSTLVISPKKRAVAALLLPKNTEKRRKDRDIPTHDFLGNTKLSDIVGLINRREVIHGDRKIRKQIKKDERLSLGGGKKKLRKLKL